MKGTSEEGTGLGMGSGKEEASGGGIERGMDASLNMEGSKYGDIFQEREQKRHQELQANLLAIKYVQTVHKNNNN